MSHGIGFMKNLYNDLLESRGRVPGTKEEVQKTISMKKQNIAITMFIFCSFLLGGCATRTLSMKEQKALSTVSVSEVLILENAYSEPNARKSINAANAGGAAGGFIGSLIGSAIDAGVMASQQNEFREKYGDCIDQIEEMMPIDLSERIESCLAATLINDDFFNEKLRDESENRLVGEVSYYGLKRSEIATSENMTMGFCIHVKISLLNSNEREVFSTLLAINSSSSHLATEYIEDPALLEKVCDESIEHLEIAFAAFLDQKLGRDS